MKVLITGAGGLLGNYLSLRLMSFNIPFVALTKSELDITSVERTNQIIESNHPTHIINCAAYTDVPSAEIEQEKCYSINFLGVKNLVDLSNNLGIFFIHISTDFVFEGLSSNFVYETDNHRNPLNYYGITKMLGEDYIINNSLNWAVVRTSWLYGKYSNNFVNKIINLAKVQQEISVTNEECGSPTYALDLANGIIPILSHKYNGIYHLTNEGIVSRFEFAKAILEYAGLSSTIEKQTGVINNTVIRPKKILLSQKNNLLEIKMRNWNDALLEYIQLDLNN